MVSFIIIVGTLSFRIALRVFIDEVRFTSCNVNDALRSDNVRDRSMSMLRQQLSAANSRRQLARPNTFVLSIISLQHR